MYQLGDFELSSHSFLDMYQPEFYSECGAFLSKLTKLMGNIQTRTHLMSLSEPMTYNIRQNMQKIYWELPKEPNINTLLQIITCLYSGRLQWFGGVGNQSKKFLKLFFRYLDQSSTLLRSSRWNSNPNLYVVKIF